ncbi:long-chain fatty acid--CoA ligase [Novosphingobium sp. Chol11]|uniref:long-chain fatty acid--CoA ligase n=1 Tax=Novosphingobium sp. Chol11 TaxID=1385763 RepID=UPI0025D970FB|nr:long-chain fatty acid--CoA ligase [Novosphingobium sp. Chol11]
MDSTMMDHALSTQMIFERGERLFGESRVVRFDGRQTSVTDYAQTARRARCLASALAELGLGPGERLGTYCWNTPAHLEAYLAVPAMGCVLHTLNVRLPASQIEYIIDHADDRILLVDAVLLPTLSAVLPGLSRVRDIIVIGDWSEPIEGFAGRVHDYEALIAACDPLTTWPSVAETDAAAICYTSGTTGLPKGVVYSHRSVFLHSLASMAADSFAISNHDRILMVPPMFHANAWGMPFSGWLAGSDMILPGQYLQPAHLAALIESERPTLMAAVPTILNDLLQAHGRSPMDLGSFRSIVCGGSAVSPVLIERVKSAWGVDVVQGWGMTETSPMCVLSHPPRGVSDAEALRWRAKSGRPVPGMQVRIVDGSGNRLPEDGKTVGQLQLRGPWVARGYLHETPEASPLSADGWLRTGDVGRIDARGYVEVTDREKDLIKSGGEWISSAELESGIAQLPGVNEVSVIAVPDERWEERPLAVIVMEPGAVADFAAMRAALLGSFARFMIPENWSVVEAIPKTSVGKLDKKAIKDKFGEGGLNVVIETRFGSGDLD